MRKIRIKPDLELILNNIYNCYVLEDDNKLDKGAQELKACYAYVLHNLELHDGIEFIGDTNE